MHSMVSSVLLKKEVNIVIAHLVMSTSAQSPKTFPLRSYVYSGLADFKPRQALIFKYTLVKLQPEVLTLNLTLKGTVHTKIKNTCYLSI